MKKTNNNDNPSEQQRLRKILWSTIRGSGGLVTARVIEAVKDIEEAAEKRGRALQRQNDASRAHDDYIDEVC